MALLNKTGEVAIKEREEKGHDVGTVDVRIGHDDDLVVAQFGHIKIIGDGRAERHDDRADLDIREHLV